jgi:non-heme chloroperoxidase
MVPVVKSVLLPSGLRLPYVERGAPTGLPMLFLHGVTDSWRSFEQVLPHLPPSIHAFALTARGHGDADRPASGYRPRDFADDLAAFMDTLALGAGVIVGHSMGASIAQRFALDYPARTLGLVLAGALHSWPASDAVMAFWSSVVSTLTDPIARDVARDFQRSTLARPISPTFFDTAVRESLKVPARVWRDVFEAFMADDFSAEVRRITAPTLVVWGDQDVIGPRGMQDALATTIADAELLVYEGAGHALHWEEPRRFAAEIVAWADRRVGAAFTSP